MTVDISELQSENIKSEKPNDKEFNFRALEAKYQRDLQNEKAEREKIARELDEIKRSHHQRVNDDDDDDSEPYIDKKRLNKTLSNLEKQFEEKIEKKAKEEAKNMIAAEKKNAWLSANNDFYDVLQHAEKLVQKNPDLAESILQMPDSFERQKLVYSNIKALGLDRPETKPPSIQEKIDSNRRMPYYQPTGVSPAPYSSAGDFSDTGQKQAFQKMQELKNRLRLS